MATAVKINFIVMQSSGPLLQVVGPMLPLTSTFHCALENGLGKGIVARHMAKPLEFPPLYNGQQGVMRAYQAGEPVPDIVIGFPL